MAIAKLRPEWEKILERQLLSMRFLRLQRFIRQEREAGKVIFPKQREIFRAFNRTSPKKAKVIIIGQDPYHTEGYADGLAFSCQVDKGLPQSLKNIFKELKSDLGIEAPNHGNLDKWAKEGVLLMNAVLTVEEGKPTAHRGMGWEVITDEAVRWLNADRKPKVFILWGNEAVQKEALISNPKHLVLKSTHPSPFSAHVNTGKFQSFFGSKPFSQANRYLVENGREPVDWKIDNLL